MAGAQTTNARGACEPARGIAGLFARHRAVSAGAVLRLRRAAERGAFVLRDDALGHDRPALARACRGGTARARDRERPMTLTVLNIAYPLAPAGPDAVGGAEQVLSLLDGALAEAGHRSIVLACEGSRTQGELISVPRSEGPLDPDTVRAAQQRHAHAVCDILRRIQIDLVHLHGI